MPQFDIHAKVIIESAAVTLTADQLAALAAQANDLRDLVSFWQEHGDPETVAKYPRRLELAQAFLDSIGGIVADPGAVLRNGNQQPGKPAGRGRGKRAAAPFDGQSS